VQATLAAGGQVWFGDETTLRELPPLRAAWAKRGQQQVVLISGRNSRRVLHGALNVQTGELVRVVRERNRQDDACAFLAALGQHRGDGPLLLVWDNNPPHKPTRVQHLAQALDIQIAWLPSRAPELNPCEDLWLHLKAEVAANRIYPEVAALATFATAWLDTLFPSERLRYASLNSSKFQWLLT
jgi:transposase